MLLYVMGSVRKTIAPFAKPNLHKIVHQLHRIINWPLLARDKEVINHVFGFRYRLKLLQSYFAHNRRTLLLFSFMNPFGYRHKNKGDQRHGLNILCRHSLDPLNDMKLGKVPHNCKLSPHLCMALSFLLVFGPKMSSTRNSINNKRRVKFCSYMTP